MKEPEAVTAARVELGRQLAALRQAAGYSQAALAPFTAYSRASLASVETGRQNVGRDFWQRADATLGTGGTLTAQFDELCGLVAAHHERRATAARAARTAKLEAWLAEPAVTAPSNTVTVPGAHLTHTGGRLLAASERLDARVVRRQQEAARLADAKPANAASSGIDNTHGITSDPVTSTAADDGAFELADALGRSNIAPHILDLLESSAIRVAQTYSTVAPPSLLEWAQTRLNAVITLLRGTQPVAQRRRLCSIAGQIAGLRAWLAHDMRQPVFASSFYSVAATAACEAEDEALYAWVLGNRSRIPIYEGKPRAALTLIEEALDRAEGHATPVVRAWLLAQASRAYSTLNDHATSGRVLAQAERMLDVAATDSGDEIVYFDVTRLAAFVGHHHLSAGRPAAAEQQIRTSLGQLRQEQVKHLALTRLDLAAVLIAQGELAEACGQAVAALTIPAEQMIDSIVRRAGRLHGQLAVQERRFAPAREVVEIIDRL